MANKLLVRVSIVKATMRRDEMTDEETKNLFPKLHEVLKEVGGEVILYFASCTDRHFYIYSFPNLDAWETFRKMAIARSRPDKPSVGWSKYHELDIDIGIDHNNP